MLKLILILGLSYLLGSIPFGYLLVRIFRGEDVRKIGSGNIGATNVSRKSPALGALTLLLDAAKGFLAVEFAAKISALESEAHLREMMAAAALFAIAGHMFPLWLKFRGGKGVATALGAFLTLAPKTILVMIAIFAAVALLFRYVSLGSIVAVALFPLLAWLLRDSGGSYQILALMAVAAVLIIARHHQNIRRLLAGTEPRFQW